MGPHKLANSRYLASRHVLDARQFSRGWLEATLFPLARELQSTPKAALPHPLAGKSLFYLFYESSTRTKVSFETAVSLLGGTTAGIDSQEHRPEDELLEDRIRVLNQYSYDFILVRYHEEGGASRAAAVSEIPVINAGDGPGQHPTQALLDAFTIWAEIGRIDDLHVALVGDLSYERTTNSLAYLLAQFSNIHLYLVSPQLLRVRHEVRDYLVEHGVKLYDTRDLRAIARDLDVVYLTRAHSARIDHASRFDEGAACYGLDRELMDALPRRAIVLHPLPRAGELPVDLDSDTRIACFRQAKNGLAVRMALLSLLAGGNVLL
jgi:aspartate carbamoyltransferase catalytic subunit